MNAISITSKSRGNPPAEILSPLYSTPEGYECETVYGLFKSRNKWKTSARVELADWLQANRDSAPEAA